jgi:hypothetical protein
LGKPIRAYRHFYGRKRELAKLTDDVRNGQCVSVVGVRRIGKTSLLFQLLDPQARAVYKLADDVLCVYIDCGRLAKIPPGQVYAEIMRRICRLENCPKLKALEKPGTTLSFHDFDDNILHLRDAGVSLVLLLDEFERLGSNPHLDVNFFLGLRALHTEYELTYVTASRLPIMELAFSHQDVLSSPFPNVFDSVRVGLFPEPEARELIQVAGVFSSPVEDFLLDLSGGHPLALQHACRYAFERRQEAGVALSLDDRFVIQSQTQEAMEGHYRYYWKNLSQEQKRVLAAPTHYAKQIKEETPVANLFKDLVTLGLLTARPDGSFCYAGRALAEFVRLEMTHDKSLRALSANDLVGQTLGQYQITAHLGRGGMADVYKAHHPSLKRDVAVKVMLPHIASDEGFSVRFQREARAVAALRHPHVVHIYDFGQENGIYYMVMEFISGGNLKALLQDVSEQGEQMALDDVLRITTQVGEALHYAHEHGLVHRDVKPSNIMLTPGEDAILTDFGVARIVGGTRLTNSNLVGTPAYMAPEQISESATVDRRADVYALAVVLYEITTGQVPFDADTPAAVIFKHLNEPLPDPRLLRPELSGAFVGIIEKALAKDPEQRYQTVQEMVDVLALALEESTL